MQITQPAATERLDLIFDIETNGFKPSVIHCLVVIIIGTGEVFRFADQPGYASISDGVALLEMADSLIGHNVIVYDAPVLRRLCGAVIPKEKLVDTLTATRILYPDMRDVDALTDLPTNLWGKHSLKAWGHRLQCHKGEFSEWARFSTTMMEYCVQDCVTSWTLYEYLREASEADGRPPFSQVTSTPWSAI